MQLKWEADHETVSPKSLLRSCVGLFSMVPGPRRPEADDPRGPTRPVPALDEDPPPPKEPEMTTAHLYELDRFPRPRPPSDESDDAEEPATALVRYRRGGTTVTDRAVVTAAGTRYRVADLDRLYTSPGPVPAEVILAVGVTAALAVTLLLVSVVRHMPDPVLVGIAGTLLTAAVTRL